MRPAGFDAVLTAVRRLDQERSGVVFVGIDGLGAAGKTTLAEWLAAQLGSAVVVSVDDFPGPDRSAWDWTRLGAEVIAPLLAGRPARYRGWDWDHARSTGWRVVPPEALLLVEGVSSTRAEADVPWSLRIWVEASPAQRHDRIRQRDSPERLRRWTEQWWPSEQAYLAGQDPRSRADLVVAGD